MVSDSAFLARIRVQQLPPMFSGKDPDLWIAAMEEFMYNCEIDPHVDFALPYIVGDAQIWVLSTKCRISDMNWCDFVYHILWEFSQVEREKSREIEDPATVTIAANMRVDSLGEGQDDCQEEFIAPVFDSLSIHQGSRFLNQKTNGYQWPSTAAQFPENKRKLVLLDEVGVIATSGFPKFFPSVSIGNQKSMLRYGQLGHPQQLFDKMLDRDLLDCFRVMLDVGQPSVLIEGKYVNGITLLPNVNDPNFRAVDFHSPIACHWYSMVNILLNSKTCMINLEVLHNIQSQPMSNEAAPVIANIVYTKVEDAFRSVLHKTDWTSFIENLSEPKLVREVCSYFLVVMLDGDGFLMGATVQEIFRCAARRTRIIKEGLNVSQVSLVCQKLVSEEQGMRRSTSISSKSVHDRLQCIALKQIIVLVTVADNGMLMGILLKHCGLFDVDGNSLSSAFDPGNSIISVAEMPQCVQAVIFFGDHIVLLRIAHLSSGLVVAPVEVLGSVAILGVITFSDLVCGPLAIGWYGQNEEGSGVMQVECSSKESTANVYMKPIEGLTVTVNIAKKEVLGFRDTGFTCCQDDKTTMSTRFSISIQLKKLQWQHIYREMRLVGVDITPQKLQGVYKAAGPGGYESEPTAFFESDGVNFSSVMGTNVLALRSDVSYDNPSGNFTKGNAGLSLPNAALVAALTLNDTGDTLTAQFETLLQQSTLDASIPIKPGAPHQCSSSASIKNLAARFWRWYLMAKPNSSLGRLEEALTFLEKLDQAEVVTLMVSIVAFSRSKIKGLAGSYPDANLRVTSDIQFLYIWDLIAVLHLGAVAMDPRITEPMIMCPVELQAFTIQLTLTGNLALHSSLIGSPEIKLCTTEEQGWASTSTISLNTVRTSVQGIMLLCHVCPQSLKVSSSKCILSHIHVHLDNNLCLTIPDDEENQKEAILPYYWFDRHFYNVMSVNDQMMLGQTGSNVPSTGDVYRIDDSAQLSQMEMDQFTATDTSSVQFDPGIAFGDNWIFHEDLFIALEDFRTSYKKAYHDSNGTTGVGKTVRDELTFGTTEENLHYCTPTNPEVPTQISAGSSSGSAGVVAAQTVNFSLGTDTVGCLGTPTSLCGVLGFGPSHGFVSTSRVIANSQSLDTIGGFARDVSGLRRVGHVLLQSSHEEFKREISGGYSVGCNNDTRQENTVCADRYSSYQGISLYRTVEGFLSVTFKGQLRDDLATLTRATVIRADVGLNLDKAEKEVLGGVAGESPKWYCYDFPMSRSARMTLFWLDDNGTIMISQCPFLAHQILYNNLKLVRRERFQVLFLVLGVGCHGEFHLLSVKDLKVHPPDEDSIAKTELEGAVSKCSKRCSLLGAQFSEQLTKKVTQFRCKISGGLKYVAACNGG